MLAGRPSTGALGPVLTALILGLAPASRSQAQESASVSPKPPTAEPPTANDGPPIEQLLALFNASEGFERHFSLNQDTGEVIAFYFGGVTGTFPWRRKDGKEDRIRLFADRVVVLLTLDLAARVDGKRAEKKGPEKKGAEKKGAEKKDPAAVESPGTEGAAKADAAEHGAGNDPAKQPSKETAADEVRRSRPRLYAEGNVRLEAPDSILEADAFFFDRERSRGVAVGVRGHGELTALARLGTEAQRREFSFIGSRGDAGAETGSLRWWRRSPDGKTAPVPATERRDARILAFRADVLRILDLDHFEGDGLVISNCEYGVPHFAVRAGAARIFPAPGYVKGAPDGKKHYIIETSRSRLELQGVPVLPLPPGQINTEWFTELPIRRIQPGHSSKFGAFLDVDWNVNWFLSRTPLARLDAARLFLEDSKIDFATDYKDRRGFGYGPEVLYGEQPANWDYDRFGPRDWNFYGEVGDYRIHDRQDEDRFGNVPIEDPDRHWTHVNHRQEIPYAGVLDVEFSDRSDENFLNEYFEPVAKQEKEQESIVYFRRSFRDNIAVTGLYKYRVEPFETVTERTPEGKFFLIEQPVARTGLYTSLQAQAAHLRNRQEESSLLPDSESDRADVLNEWSYPFSLGRYARLRPFAQVRYTAYDEGAPPDTGNVDRFANAAGMTVSQEWSRIYRFPRGGIAERWFGMTGLKHAIVPKVTYRNLYENDVEPAEVPQFDDVDTVNTDERFELSLRNELIARSPQAATAPPPALPGQTQSLPGQTQGRSGRAERKDLRRLPAVTRSFLSTELSLDWFLHPERDNAGKRVSFLDVDVTLSPNDRLWIYNRSFFDPTEEMRFEATDTGITTIVVPEVLRLTVGERFVRETASFTYVQGTLEMSRSYILDAYYAYNFEEGKAADFEFRLARILHRWVLDLRYSVDVGEDSNQSISVNVQPLELFMQKRAKRGTRLDYGSERR